MNLSRKKRLKSRKKKRVEKGNAVSGNGVENLHLRNLHKGRGTGIVYRGGKRVEIRYRTEKKQNFVKEKRVCGNSL